MTENWDAIAEWYVRKLADGSALHEFARDILLDAIPGPLRDLRVLDLGCGEGIVTRSLARRGARAHGIDPAARLLGHARAVESTDPTGATYAVDDGETLATVADRSVDGVTAGLALNNVPDLDRALRAVRRVLVPVGWCAFTVPHPCFEAPHAGWTDRGDGPRGRVVGDYLAEGFWRSANPRGVRRAGNQHRTVATYLTALIAAGFEIAYVAEPRPDAAVAAEQPQRAELPPFLVVRATLA